MIILVLAKMVLTTSNKGILSQWYYKNILQKNTFMLILFHYLFEYAFAIQEGFQNYP